MKNKGGRPRTIVRPVRLNISLPAACLRRLRTLSELSGESLSATVTRAANGAYRALTQSELDAVLTLRMRRKGAIQ